METSSSPLHYHTLPTPHHFQASDRINNNGSPTGTRKKQNKYVKIHTPQHRRDNRDYSIIIKIHHHQRLPSLSSLPLIHHAKPPPSTQHSTTIPTNHSNIPIFIPITLDVKRLQTSLQNRTLPPQQVVPLYTHIPPGTEGYLTNINHQLSHISIPPTQILAKTKNSTITLTTTVSAVTQTPPTTSPR